MAQSTPVNVIERLMSLAQRQGVTSFGITALRPAAKVGKIARFMLQRAFVFGLQQVRVRAGRVLADSQANAQAGDAVWTGLNSATLPAGAVPLDASATTMWNASPWAGTAAQTVILGVDSVDV